MLLPIAATHVTLVEALSTEAGIVSMACLLGPLLLTIGFVRILRRAGAPGSLAFALGIACWLVLVIACSAMSRVAFVLRG